MSDDPLDLTGALTPRELSEHLGVNTETLYRWRKTGIGPRFVKVGGRYRYPLASVREWVEQSAATTTEPKG